MLRNGGKAISIGCAVAGLTLVGLGWLIRRWYNGQKVGKLFAALCMIAVILAFIGCAYSTRADISSLFALLP
jgi:uncharacterized membrane protein